MASYRISRQDQAPHCGSTKSRSRPVTRLNNAPQPAVSDGRLSRKDVIFTPGAIVRSSSADRRHIGTCSIPRQVASEIPAGVSDIKPGRKDSPDGCPNKELLEEYMRLMKMADSNEVKINIVEKEIEQQERNIETVLEKNVAHQKNLETNIRKHSETHKIHRNFMGEATRVRVEHKEQEISADILKDNVEEIKDEIRILNDKIVEVKERRTFGKQSLTDGTADMKHTAGQMEMENNVLDVETDAMSDELNAMRIEIKELGIEHPRSRSNPVIKFEGNTPLIDLKGGTGSPPPPTVRRLSENDICGTTLKCREPIASRSLSKISRKSPSPRNGNQPMMDEELELDNKNTEDKMTRAPTPTLMKRSRSPSPPTRRNIAFLFEMGDDVESNTSLGSSVAKKRQAMLSKMKEREHKRGKNDAPKLKCAVEEISTKPANGRCEYSANKIPPQSRAQLVTVLELQRSGSRHSFTSRVPKPVNHLQWSAKRDPVRLVPSDKKRGNVMQRKDYCRLDFLNDEEVLHPGLYGTWVSMRKDEVDDDDIMDINSSSRQQSFIETMNDTSSYTDTKPKRDTNVIRSKTNHGQYTVKKAATVNKVKINHTTFVTKKPIVSRINHGQFHVEKSEIVNIKQKINHDIFQTKKPISSKINHGQFDHAKKPDPIKIQINHGSYKTNKASHVTSKINHGQFDTKKTTKAIKANTSAKAESTKLGSKVVKTYHGMSQITSESDNSKCVVQQQSKFTNKIKVKPTKRSSRKRGVCDGPQMRSVSNAKGLYAVPLPPIKTQPRTPLSSARTPLPPIKSSSKSSSTTQSRSGCISSTISSNRKLPPIYPGKHLIGDQNCRIGTTENDCKLPLSPLSPPVTSTPDVDIKDLQPKPKEAKSTSSTKIPRPIKFRNNTRRGKEQKSTTAILPKPVAAPTTATDGASDDEAVEERNGE